MEGGDEHDLQTGSKEVTPFLISLPPSTDLDVIDFIPAFAPEEEVASDFQGGAGGR